MKHTPLAMFAYVLISSATAQTPAATEDPALPQAAAAFESGVLLNATDLLPAECLRGASYRVRDQVATDGYMAHFEIDSDFGTFDATGVPQARLRMRELEAIRKLVETSKSDLFAEGMKRSLKQPVTAVKNIVKDPVAAAKQAPKTVGHFFGKVGSSIGRGAERLSAGANGSKDGGDDAAEVGRGIGAAAQNAAGFDKARLETAKQLGVDPYSDNVRLQEEIDKVTWAFFAGGLPLRIGTAVASAGIAVAATTMVGIPEDTYALTQSEIEFRDTKALTQMGIAESTIKEFFLNAALSTTRRHLIVTRLTAMPKTTGRDEIVALAVRCTTPEQAEFLIDALAILSAQRRTAAVDYAAFKVVGQLPGALTAAGDLHVPAPVDHVTWTEDVAGFAQRDDLGTAPKTLLHTGRLSVAAKAGFAAAGWHALGVAYPSR